MIRAAGVIRKDWPAPAQDGHAVYWAAMHEPVGHGHWPRLRRSLWAMTFFLLGFAGLIAVVAFYYLVPAIDAAHSADTAGRRQLSAFSMLLMAVILFVLLVGLAM